MAKKPTPKKDAAKKAMDKRRTATKTKKDTAPKTPKTPKAEKPLNECSCGCGAMVKGRFAQGHDAKLKGQLLKVVYDPTASKMDRAKARTRLDKEGWNHFINESRLEEEEGRHLRAQDKASKDVTSKGRKISKSKDFDDSPDGDSDIPTID